jgi:predicted TIM-barrel fold metal-dependent hydrolase
MRLYDADTHVIEPPTLWQERVPRNLRGKAPKVIRQSEEIDAWSFGDGKRVVPLSALAATSGVSPVTWVIAGTNYAHVRKGAFEPNSRLADMDVDMVYAQLLHPTIAIGGSVTFSEHDAELQRVCTAAYNDWMSDFCSVDPSRLIGLAMIPMTGIDDAIKELQRARALPGIHGALLGSYPNGGAFPSPEDDRFWAVAQDLDMAVVIHFSLFGGDGEGGEDIYKLSSPALILARINLERCAKGIMQELSRIILTGIPERFPKLRIIGTETGVGWIPYFLEQTDDNFLRHRFWAKTDLKMLPSEYFRRQCFATFQVDTNGVRNRASMLENIMWSSDFPHSGADWPNSVVTVERNMAGVTSAERELMLTKNCIRAFGLAAAT